MLKKGIKNIFIFFSFLLLLQSCGEGKKDEEKSISKIYAKENFAKYKDIYVMINDSVNYFINSKLNSFLTEYANEWQVDSMICINSSADKLVGIIISSAGIVNRDVTDDATKFLGKKINDKWYFFKGGGSLAILRSSFGKTGSNPLTFHELSQIGRKEMLEGALIKNETGEYVVNDKWVDSHFTDLGWGKFKNPDQYDSVHWFYIIDKWKHKIDTNEYKPLHKSKKEVLP